MDRQIEIRSMNRELGNGGLWAVTEDALMPCTRSVRLRAPLRTSTSTSTMGSCGRVGKNIRLTRSQRRGTSPSPAQAIRLTLTGRKMLPSGRKPNSRISTGDPLPSSRISAGDPLPSNRISTGDPLPIRVGPSQLARRTPKGLPQDLRT